ncbi:MAG: hypothetical protein CSA45_06405 [Gammaproteobacteria bacterium]|nr:MAG: hypothetical protein CSA45_06405 [Gammaproteobacteria bacterium]
MLAKTKLTERLSELEAQQEQCRSVESDLPENLFEGTDLSVDIVRNALLYRYFSHQQDCIREALGNYYIALASVAIFYPGEVSLQTGDFNFVNRRTLLESQAAYESLPAEKKASVDKLTALDKPFTMESAVKLLENYSQ